MMNILEILKSKRDGGKLNSEEIEFVINGYTRGEIPDYQMSAFLMAVFLNGMNEEETAALTKSMLYSGEVLDFSDISGIKVDKHSTGGVGDKTSLVLAPVAAAAGVRVPMISGRGLGHSGGTLDKLEAIPGFNVRLSEKQFRKGVEEVGMCLIGQTEHIAPADKKIYALRDVTATVECIPLIVASIMSKKLAEGIDALVLDVKVGEGAFMKTMKDARLLANSLIKTGHQMGKRVNAIISNMDQPLGENIGNSIEVAECIDILNGSGPDDTVSLSLELAAEMICLAGLAESVEEGYKIAKKQIETGRAKEIFRRCISYQGGNPDVVDDAALLPRSKHKEQITANESGWISMLNAFEIGMATVLLGGGRIRKEDVIDPAVGVSLKKKVGQKVEKGEIIAEIHYNDHERLKESKLRIENAIKISKEKVDKPGLILERIEL